jgi:hypothetical protein
MVRNGIEVMARILHKGNWYSPVKSSSIYESVYEQKIIAHAEDLFPGYFCLSFKKPVDSMYGTGIPDLVLIDKTYREWIVVEVELEHHALRGDVEDQVKKFSVGQFDESHTKYLCDKEPLLNFDKLNQLIKGTQPKITVIVPIDKPSWWKSLLQYNARIAIIEIWEDDTNRYLLRVNGDQPTAINQNFLTRVFRDNVTASGLRVDNPAVLPDTTEIRIQIEKYSTTWRIIRSKSVAWLMPSGRSPIDDLSALSFKLSVNQMSEYILEVDNGKY